MTSAAAPFAAAITGASTLVPGQPNSGETRNYWPPEKTVPEMNRSNQDLNSSISENAVRIIQFGSGTRIVLKPEPMSEAELEERRSLELTIKEINLAKSKRQIDSKESELKYLEGNNEKVTLVKNSTNSGKLVKSGPGPRAKANAKAKARASGSIIIPGSNAFPLQGRASRAIRGSTMHENFCRFHEYKPGTCQNASKGPLPPSKATNNPSPKFRQTFSTDHDPSTSSKTRNNIPKTSTDPNQGQFKKQIVYRIKEDAGLVRAAKKACKNADVQNDVNHLEEELARRTRY